MRFPEICNKSVICGLALASLVPHSDAHAADFQVLYAFKGPPDGDLPLSGVILDSVGNLYGTTDGGGTADGGSVYKLAPDGTESLLHSFQGGSDGAGPFAGLIQDNAGNLFGTTSGGGGAGCGDSGGCGTVFKLAPDGTETVLHAFAGGGDGAYLYGGVVIDNKGNLYGTTEVGGSGGCSGSLGDGCGTVFKLASNGTKTVLYSFTGGNDGYYPAAGLIRRADKLYGTASGGSGSCSGGCGIVFKLAAGGVETVLYSFKGGSDGFLPSGGLIADKEGNLYGTTFYGGSGDACTGSCGVVFRLAPDGTETVLHAFTGGNDGAYPNGGVIMDSKGNLYGTTEAGGNGSTEAGGRNGPLCSGAGCGTVFKLAPDGTETVLHAFKNKNNGMSPDSVLFADGKGNLYGTTLSGQHQTLDGSVFELKK